MPRTASRPSTTERPTLPANVHKRGCPMAPDRIESYPMRRPQRQGGGLVTVVRCVECGNAQYLDERGRIARDIDPNQGGNYGPMEIGPEVAIEDHEEMT